MPSKPGEEPRNAGQRIHVFARILAIADLYERLTIGDDGQRRPNVEILHLMRTRYAGWLDPEIMKVVPGMIPPFPPGVRVTLTDGSEAVTVGLRPERPYQPMVKRIEKKDPFTLATETLDLTLEKDLGIDKVAGVSARDMIPPEPAPAAARASAQAGKSLASASA
jgi:hypothetical protein